MTGRRNKYLSKHLVTRAIGIFILVVFGMVLVPGDYYHDLAGHRDTRCIQHDGRFFELQHHHCELLKFQLHKFLSELLLVNIPASFTYAQIQAVDIPAVSLQSYPFALLRAPPQHS